MVKEAEEDKKKKAKPKAKPKEEKREEPKAEAHKEAKHEAHAPKAESPKAEAPAAAEKAEPAKARKRKAPAKKAVKVFVARGKRKESVARATITEGKGVVRINSQKLESLSNRYVQDIIREPLRYVGPEANTVDISVNVNGGGAMGQAQAARTAIANALSMYFDGMNLRKKFVEIDRSLVIEDTRRVESKKFRGPKARARFQKSYR